MQIQNFTCINYYLLERVARLPDLRFDRARTAEKIYRDLESKHKVRIFKQATTNRTFISFTKQGQKDTQKIDSSDFTELANSRSRFRHLRINNLKKNKVEEQSLVKGLRIKPSKMNEA
jgi:threonine aldolase